MQKVIRLKLLKDPGTEGGFCMSVGSIVEFHNGGFKTVGVNKNYYPVFGPYTLLERIATELVNGTATDSAKELFEVADVTNTVFPTQLHDIMDEAGGQLICTVAHSGLMSLLNSRLITSFRHSKEDEMFRISNMLHIDEVCAHAIKVDIVADVRNESKNLKA